MKQLLVALLLASLPAARVSANPYFRLLDLNHAHFAAGALVDPGHTGANGAATELAIITHSPRDGCLLPSVVCEDWSPLALGGAFNAGRGVFAIGPSINMSPVLKALALSAVNAVTKEDSDIGLKVALAPDPTASFSISVAPQWAVEPTQNWKGYFKLFIGPAWSF